MTRWGDQPYLIIRGLHRGQWRLLRFYNLYHWIENPLTDRYTTLKQFKIKRKVWDSEVP